MVGRDAELGIVARFLGRLGAGCRVLLLEGEAGIGKTALVGALTRASEARGAVVLTGHCYDLTETPPYGPWVELFGQYASSDTVPLPEAFALATTGPFRRGVGPPLNVSK